MLKIAPTLLTEYGELKMVPAQRLHSYRLVFIYRKIFCIQQKEKHKHKASYNPFDL